MLTELENRLNLLELKCRHPVEHLLAGEYRSVFHGRGIEFEDIRPYQAGDDVRAMDWKITARTGEPHIKRFIEEREQFIYLLVDVSASMLHGTDGNKRKTMAEVSALITLAAIKNQDRVGLIMFSDKIEQVIPPAKGRNHAMRIMDQLMNFQPTSKGTNLTEMLSRFGQIAHKQSVAFVVSDFLTEDYLSELQTLAFRHDINAIHITEKQLDPTDAAGLVRIADAESDELSIIDAKAERDHSTMNQQQLRQTMMESRVNLLDLEVGSNCVEALSGFFQSRLPQTTNETGG